MVKNMNFLDSIENFTEHQELYVNIFYTVTYVFSVNNTIRSSNFNIHIVIWGDRFTYRLPPDISISLKPVEIPFRYQLLNVQKGRVYISQ